MNCYKKLEQKFSRIAKLKQMYDILFWDEQVNMPGGSSSSRSQVIAESKLLQQEILLSKDLPNLLEGASSEKLNPWQKANLNAMNISYLDATAVPKELNSAWIIAVMKSKKAWRELRNPNKWTEYQPFFAEVVNLSRQRAEARAETYKISLYDALLKDAQEGMDAKLINGIFNDIKAWLPGLIKEAIANQNTKISPIQPLGPFAVSTQKELCLSVMKDMGFNFNFGRLDVSHHPFCGGVPSDVRITTKYSEDSFTQSLMAVIHETGHALYEQNLPEEWEFQPVGKHLGMSVHEGQSLLFEMQIGRSEEFLHYLTPKIQSFFGRSGAIIEDNLIKLYQKVRPGYIRIDADEVTYQAHVLLRYEIEKELMENNLKVTDVPHTWNEKMQSYLGIDTSGNYKDGCMQDMHWPSGLFGYFPSYTLGAIIAAQLFHKIKNSENDLNADISRGDLSKVKSWLINNLWSKASLVPPTELINNITGEALTVKYLKDHLIARYIK
jgi:carboxypeptidase Taq